jgi:hypothetical protein
MGGLRGQRADALGLAPRHTSPLSGSSSRLISFIAVVLPEPDAPTSAMKAPASTASETSRSAKVRPPSNDLLTWSSSMSGAVAMGERIYAVIAGRRGSGEPAIQTAIPQRTPSLPHPFSFKKASSWREHIEFARQCRAARTAGGVIYPPRNRRQVFRLGAFRFGAFRLASISEKTSLGSDPPPPRSPPAHIRLEGCGHT